MRKYRIKDDPELNWENPDTFKRFAIGQLISGLSPEERKAAFEAYMNLSPEDLITNKDTADTYEAYDIDDDKADDDYGEFTDITLNDLYGTTGGEDPYDDDLYSLVEPEAYQYRKMTLDTNGDGDKDLELVDKDADGDIDEVNIDQESEDESDAIDSTIDEIENNMDSNGEVNVKDVDGDEEESKEPVDTNAETEEDEEESDDEDSDTFKNILNALSDKPF